MVNSRLAGCYLSACLERRGGFRLSTDVKIESGASAVNGIACRRVFKCTF